MLTTSTMHEAKQQKNASEPEFLYQRVNDYYQERLGKSLGGRHLLQSSEPQPGAVLMVSNDYLGLNGHPDIVRAQREALGEQHDGVLMSAAYLHGECPQTRFESRLAEFTGYEDALLSQSGYSANVGLLQAITAPDIPVYVDLFAHMSLWEGVRSARAKPVPFRHNDVEQLEHLIRRHGTGVIVVDSVYSTSGSLAPLTAILEVAERHGCIFVVDESHSLGTHGPNGAGLVAAAGLTDRVHFVTASLAKAFAGRAGMIAGSARLTEYIKYHSFPAIFSSALLPYEIAGLEQTLTLIRESNTRRRNLHRNADYLRSQLDSLGYNVDISEAQIIPLEPGPEPRTIVFRDALEARGVFGSVFCAPATTRNRSLMRFSINAAMTRKQLDHVVAVCKEIREQVGMQGWASTRRRRSKPFADAA